MESIGTACRVWKVWKVWKQHEWSELHRHLHLTRDPTTCSLEGEVAGLWSSAAWRSCTRCAAVATAALTSGVIALACCVFRGRLASAAFDHSPLRSPQVILPDTEANPHELRAPSGGVDITWLVEALWEYDPSPAWPLPTSPEESPWLWSQGERGARP